MGTKKMKFRGLISTDVQISRIYTVYFGSQTDWARPVSLPRYANGLVFFSAGSIRYQFEDHSIVANAGDVVIFPKGCLYRGVSLSAVNSFYVIDFDLMEAPLFGLSTPLLLHPSQTATEAMFRKALHQWNAPELGSKLLCRSQIYELLCFLLRCAGQQTGQNERVFIDKAVAYIRANYTQPDLYVHQIASAMFVSESQLRRTFHQVLRCSPTSVLLSVRLEQSKNLLLYSRRPISEIAECCGFTSAYYFCRVFKQSTGVTPSRFRQF